jgi:hypothetical protein
MQMPLFMSPNNLMIRISEVTLKIIHDINNNHLLKFQTGTTLDNIIPDLWSVIVTYMQYPFIVGLASEKYDGYRPLTETEFYESKDKFFGTYFESEKFIVLTDTKAYTYLDLRINGHNITRNYQDVFLFRDNNKLCFTSQFKNNNAIEISKKTVGQTESIIMMVSK